MPSNEQQNSNLRWQQAMKPIIATMEKGSGLIEGRAREKGMEIGLNTALENYGSLIDELTLACYKYNRELPTFNHDVWKRQCPDYPKLEAMYQASLRIQNIGSN